MGMDESNAALASADDRLAAMQRQIESLGRVSGGFMDGADDQIGTINGRDPQQYSQPLQIATGPSTGPIDFVNKPQAAAPDAGPTPVKEAKSHYDDYYRMAGVKAGEGAYTDLAPGDKTAHPLLQQFGLYDQQRHNRILQLADSQARIREMVDKAHQKKINDSINPKPDIGDPNVPPGIKPNTQQVFNGFPAPTFDLPDVSTPNSSPLYPENQTMPQPRGPMNDLQEALMASYVGGHLTNNNGTLEPTSLVAAQGRMLSPEAQELEQRLQDENLKRYGLAPQEQPSQPGDDGAINLDPINVAAKPLTYQPVPASVMNARLQRQAAIAVKAGRLGENNKPSELKKLIDERDALAPDSPLRPTYDAAIKSKEGRNIDSDTRIWEALFPGEAILAKSNQLVTPDAIQRAAQNGYRISPNMTRAQALETSLSQYGEKMAKANATGRIEATLSAPAKADETSNLFDRNSFINEGKLVQAKGPISERQARGMLHITDKNLDQLTAVDQAGEAMKSVHDMGRKLFTAKTPAQAIVQAGKFYASANPLSRVFVPGSDETVYQDSLAALSNNLAKAFGGERGVLTNVDVTRWTNAMAHPSDTDVIVAKKEALTGQLYDSALRAQRRAIAGDTVLTEKKKIGGILDQLERLDGSSRQATSGPAAGDIEDGYRFKGGDRANPKNWEKVQ